MIVFIVGVIGILLVLKPEQRARIFGLFSSGKTASVPQYHRMKTLKRDMKEKLFDDDSSSEDETLFAIDAASEDSESDDNQNFTQQGVNDDVPLVAI